MEFRFEEIGRFPIEQGVIVGVTGQYTASCDGIEIPDFEAMKSRKRTAIEVPVWSDRAQSIFW